MILLGALLACGDPPPPPRDLGPTVPVLDMYTATVTTDLVGWTRTPENGQIRMSDHRTGRTALFRDDKLTYAALELKPDACAAALAQLDALGAPADSSCADRRWPIGGGFASYGALDPGAGCLITWDVEDHPLDRRPLDAMADFRGAVFGAPRAQIEGLIPAPDDTTGTVFVRPTDALEWGGVPLSALEYHFDADRLWQVELRPADGDKGGFEAAWAAVFGPGRDGWWQGCAVSASWEYSTTPRFTVRSRAISWERSQRSGGAAVSPG